MPNPELSGIESHELSREEKITLCKKAITEYLTILNITKTKDGHGKILGEDDILENAEHYGAELLRNSLRLGSPTYAHAKLSCSTSPEGEFYFFVFDNGWEDIDKEGYDTWQQTVAQHFAEKGLPFVVR